MVRVGIRERIAQQISGHRTRSVLDHYRSVSDTDLKGAAWRQAHYVFYGTVPKAVTNGAMDQLWQDSKSSVSTQI
jgi:hypothetical protein